MEATGRPGIWLSANAGIVARCNQARQNQEGKGRKEKAAGRVTDGKAAVGMDSRL